MTMRYDSISRVGHFNHTILREIRKVCTTKAGLGIHFHIYTIW
ncbi:hypothetical protein B4079_1780 [Bacillus cereus]|nr:hypothetical protein B4079_1780 [Bacillus cereus]SMD63850.1 hypothetical protein BACERE00184_00411 [Bacillus cereus]